MNSADDLPLLRWRESLLSTMRTLKPRSRCGVYTYRFSESPPGIGPTPTTRPDVSLHSLFLGRSNLGTAKTEGLLEDRFLFLRKRSGLGSFTDSSIRVARNRGKWLKRVTTSSGSLLRTSLRIGKHTSYRSVSVHGNFCTLLDHR